MTTQTFDVTGYDSGEDQEMVFDASASSGTGSSLVATMDEPVSLYPLSADDALRGLLMTREIEASPEEAASARRSARQYEEAEIDCLADDESVSDAIDSEN